MVNIRIELSKPDKTYIAGELLQGTVSIGNSDEEKVRSVYILVTGVAEVEWSEEESYRDSKGDTHYRSVTYSSREQYLNSQTVVFGQIGGPKVKFPAGHHQYEFACALPDRLPGTMTNKDADIKYKVKVVMDVPWGIDHSDSEEFIVQNVIDLNQNPTLRMPVQGEDVKSFCLFRCSPQLATVSAHLPLGGFVPGAEVPISCRIDNRTSVVFEGISVKLRRLVTATATSPHWKQRHSDTVFAQSEHTLTQTVGDPIQNVTVDLQLPNACPVSCPYASYITTEYFIDVKFRIVGCHSDVTLHLPIQMGSVPISNGPDDGRFQVPLAPMPTAPPMEEKSVLLNDQPPTYNEATATTQKEEDRSIGWSLI